MRTWLRIAREANGLTMKELSGKLDISESYYCAIENGTRQRKMDFALLSALATILEISLENIAKYEAEWVGSLAVRYRPLW